MTQLVCPRCQSSLIYSDEDDAFTCYGCGHGVVDSLLRAKA